MSAHGLVAGVIWTYNRFEIVERCVRALLAQSHPLTRIVAVDSASPDQSGVRLGSTFGDQIIVITLADNAGPGAAIAAAFECEAVASADAVWLVEDDSCPAEDCLARLVASADNVGKPAMVGPDGAILRRGQWRPQPRLPLGSTAVVDFVYLDGALITTDIIHRCGGPRQDYFLMVLDVEYPLRLRRAGVTMVQVGVQYEALRLGATGEDSGWRAYYQTRNHLHLAMSHRSARLLGGFAIRTGKHTVHAVRIRDWNALRLRARGIADGVRGRMGRTLEPDAQ